MKPVWRVSVQECAVLVLLTGCVSSLCSHQCVLHFLHCFGAGSDMSTSAQDGASRPGE